MLVSSKCCEFRFLVHERGDLYFTKTKFGKSHLRLLVVGYVIRARKNGLQLEHDFSYFLYFQLFLS